jgi:hypothetical protein
MSFYSGEKIFMKTLNTKLNSFSLLAMVVLSSSIWATQAHAFSYPPHPVELRLQSVEGLNIVITAQDQDYGNDGDSETRAASNIVITVNGSHVGFGSSIRAVLTPNCISGEYHWPISQPTVYADLSSQTDGSSLDFSGSFQGSVMTNSAVHGGEWINCQPQLSIVVDGNWQTDPVDGTHNFNLMNF